MKIETIGLFAIQWINYRANYRWWMIKLQFTIFNNNYLIIHHQIFLNLKNIRFDELNEQRNAKWNVGNAKSKINWDSI